MREVSRPAPSAGVKSGGQRCVAQREATQQGGATEVHYTAVRCVFSRRLTRFSHSSRGAVNKRAFTCKRHRPQEATDAGADRAEGLQGLHKGVEEIGLACWRDGAGKGRGGEDTLKEMSRLPAPDVTAEGSSRRKHRKNRQELAGRNRRSLRLTSYRERFPGRRRKIFPGSHARREFLPVQPVHEDRALRSDGCVSAMSRDRYALARRLRQASIRNNDDEEQFPGWNESRSRFRKFKTS